MESIDTSLRLQTLGNSIDDLPDEVLEFVLGFLPPYKDLQDCMCVCKRWYICAQNVMRKTSNKLIKAIAEFKIQWRNITPVDMAPTITKRFSHAACVHENSMYIFGGCTTNSTAFNDLWRFDLSKRQWIRPLAMGTYPAPKAYASMICYKDCLILFGGWTYPSPSQYYQDWTMFSEIHFYNITSNRWILINASNNPPPMAGHSATVHNDQMIVFGGLYKPLLNPLLVRCSNDVWVLDIGRMSWHKQATSEARPAPRYGQSLISLDNNNLMILGGVQAPHNRFVYNDCWILTMEGPVWTWREITVKNKEWSAANIWCNPACKVGDKVVSLSRNQNGVKQIVTSAVRLTSRNRPDNTSVLRRVEQCARKPLDKDLNINGRRGALPHRRTNSAEGSIKADNTLKESADDSMPGPSTSGLSLRKQMVTSPSLDSMEERRMQANGETAKRQIENNNPVIPPKSFSNKDVPVRRKTSPLNKPNGMKIVHKLHEADKFRMAAFACDASIHVAPPENDLVNQRQIGHLDQRPQAERMLPDNGAAPQPAVKKLRRNTLTMHVLDISTVLNGNSLTSVSWLCPTQGEVSGAPEELVMYSLVRGKGELIMFGGVHNDINLLSNYSSSHQYQYSNSLHFIIPPRDII